jgi:hypothetical protein
VTQEKKIAHARVISLTNSEEEGLRFLPQLKGREGPGGSSLVWSRFQLAGCTFGDIAICWKIMGG